MVSPERTADASIMVYVASAASLTRLFFTAMALSVVVSLMGIAALYWVLLVVGVSPLVV